MMPPPLGAEFPAPPTTNLRKTARMASNTTFQKRQKERARQDRQRVKDAARKLRRDERAAPRAAGEPGVDPDIAGIIPGPQPVVEES
jgi:hypothetical protein